MASASSKFNVRNPAVKRIMQVGGHSRPGPVLETVELMQRSVPTFCWPMFAGDQGAAG